MVGLSLRLEKLWRDKPIAVKDAFSAPNRVRMTDEARVAQAVLRALELRRESVSEMLRALASAVLEAAAPSPVTLTSRACITIRLYIAVCRLAGEGGKKVLN